MGNRSENLGRAVSGLQQVGATLIRASSVYETEPWGFSAGKSFFNQVLEMEASLTPQQMIVEILRIESALGRTRSVADEYQSRIIDIDILLVDDIIIREEGLEVPHPKMHDRKFVLVPAVEIAPEWEHPIMKKSLSDILNECSDTESVERI